MDIKDITGFGFVNEAGVDALLTDEYVEQTDALCESIVQDVANAISDPNNFDTIKTLNSLIPDIMSANNQVSMIGTARLVRSIQEASTTEEALEAVVFAYADEVGLPPIYTKVKE